MNFPRKAHAVIFQLNLIRSFLSIRIYVQSQAEVTEISLRDTEIRSEANRQYIFQSGFHESLAKWALTVKPLLSCAVRSEIQNFKGLVCARIPLFVTDPRFTKTAVIDRAFAYASYHQVTDHVILQSASLLFLLHW